MTSLVRLRIIEIEGNADALLPLLDRLLVQGDSYEKGQLVRSNGESVSAGRPPAAADRPLSPPTVSPPENGRKAGRGGHRPRSGAPAGNQNAHKHHWLVDPPNGPTSSGRCSCGSVQEFRNSREEEAPPPGERRRGALRVAAQTGRYECSGCHADVRTKVHRRQCLGKDV